MDEIRDNIPAIKRIARSGLATLMLFIGLLLCSHPYTFTLCNSLLSDSDSESSCRVVLRRSFEFLREVAISAVQV